MTGRSDTPTALTAAQADFLRERRFGRLATASADGTPAVVPICYALIDAEHGALIVSALDAKPKRVEPTSLRRIRNILANPLVSLVVDDTSEDWSRLAFVQVNGDARLVEPGDPIHSRAIAALRTKYPQYESMSIELQPVIAITPRSTTGWQGGGELALPRPQELAAVIPARRSVRALRPDPVPREVVERAIAAAGWAPSPHGRQPWRFVVLVSEAGKRTLADAMATTWQEQLALDGQDDTIIALRLAKGRDRILTAPVLVLACLYPGDLDAYPDAERENAEQTMAIQSLGAALQNLLLTIYADGYDAGWMCAPLFCPEVVRDALGLDRALIPHALIPIGLAAKDPVRRPRLSPESLIADWQ